MIRVRRSLQHPLAGNVVALSGSMLALGLATLWIARVGGPVAVGDYALLRILPWLLAVLVSGGLAGSIAYFLAGPTRDNPHLRATLVAIGLTSALVGALIWLAGSPIVRLVFFQHLPVTLIAWVALRVVLRLFVITGKAAAQGSGDLPGSNLTILLEELVFLPAFALTQAMHVTGETAIVAALILADLVTGSVAWTRLMRRGFLTRSATPSLELARRIYVFAARGQLGSLLALVNLRFDFILLAALAGPATLGFYAVASKYAEILRVLPIAANWVLYPRFARAEAPVAVASSRRLMLRAGAATAFMSVPLFFAANLAIPVLFGDGFRAAVLPARILLIGLAAEGVAGVATAFLYGRGRPGLNSLGAGAGMIVTVVLDLALIPRFGAVGAAVASTIAYLITTTTLFLWYRHVARSISAPGSAAPGLDGLPSLPPGRGRRYLDIIVSLLVLCLAWPLLLILVIGARLSTGGSAIYRQGRVGQGGVPFTMFKLRSMRPGAAGPEITRVDDARVTRLGAFLRATSLDELPQLWNVLRGDMTLVGPRPETVALAQRYADEYRRLFAYRPGLTGPVQVRLRDAVPQEIDDVEMYYLTELLPQRCELDLAFLANPTLGATLTLLAETARHVLSRTIFKLARRSRRRIGIVAELKSTT